MTIKYVLFTQKLLILQYFIKADYLVDAWLTHAAKSFGIGGCAQNDEYSSLLYK